ncbi:MAG: hypothetical protein A3G05_01285 [Candidatus Zambryskibacteria bacterium RIFCSPLOWO2_12_FULL_45_14]|uniref:Baseplate protein J-like domain-containing protein n=2 Tax=Candidatus Zambryskiibacteriota TaxID=1817925 RepID=A0A1G2UKK8_9BACT|nr:MAG: hypothetical protein A3H60_00020 [Candidatus Zambryskibacteria bacterium RIFCSPLOWO2_02_FULL_44_12b]OHB13816.1 MAG: hypothetical protein A3G05_01285 [Candidatus Zambryskibacteria bacterium RIFCSPLOWO2_12_FULL_45_14]
MPKSIDDIIVVDKKRSIRDIPIPESRRNIPRYSPPFIPRSPEPPVTPNIDGSINTENLEIKGLSRFPRKRLWIASGVALVVLIFAILSIWNGATLAYVPKSASLSFNNDIYTARKSGEGELLYSVVKLSKEKGVDVPASGEEQVSRKASGTIVVYNNASTEAQRLIATTRFETTAGLVYRVAKDIVIPGKKTVAGVSQPGSIEVVVFADVAGEKYNIGLSDFTLPGLKGSARFSTIYARSKTVMSGGFVGTEKVVSGEEKTKARSQLETALREELISETTAQVPEDFILLPALSYVVFEDLPQTSSVNRGNVVINLRGNLYGVMFKRSDLFNHLAKEKTPLATGELVDIVDINALDVALMGGAPEGLPNSSEIKLSVTGQALALWRTDEVALKTDLAGRHKKDLSSILGNYPTVISATATIRPFWKSSFPDDVGRIKVEKLPVE